MLDEDFKGGAALLRREFLFLAPVALVNAGPPV